MLIRVLRLTPRNHVTTWILLCFLICTACEITGTGGGGGGGGGSIGRGASGATVILGDRPNEDLAALQLQITKLEILETSGLATEIFNNTAAAQLNIQRFAATPKIL